MIGCYRLPDGYVSEDLCWDAETVSKGFAELFDKGFATRDFDSKWVFIHAFLKWNGIENPNQAIPAIKIALSLPAGLPFRPSIIKALNDSTIRFKDKIRPDVWNPFETLCQTVSKPETETETETGTEAGAELLPPHSENFPGTSLSVAIAPDPKNEIPQSPKAETELQASCRETWHSYATAYAERYGVDPVRNAKVSSQVKQFVQRIGREEAPPVAAFFVGHSSSFYVRKSHDVGSLLTDAEKLRMEWATGRMVTVTSAQQSDRTQSNFNAANEALKILESRRATT